jgi:acetyltransferase-like isoleucine patch superfamily enzyme
MKNVVQKAVAKILDFLAKLIRPRMIYGFRRIDGMYLPLVRIGSTTFIDHKESFFPEDNVYIGHHNFIEASNEIRIGRGCQITDFVSITTHSSHNSIRYYNTAPSVGEIKGYIHGRIIIGEFTFIGPHTVIMPGTTIGKGCIVSAFSYVKGNFPDFSVIKGNPAQIVGSTKERDSSLINDNPELGLFYNSWSGLTNNT